VQITYCKGARRAAEMMSSPYYTLQTGATPAAVIAQLKEIMGGFKVRGSTTLVSSTQRCHIIEWQHRKNVIHACIHVAHAALWANLSDHSNIHSFSHIVTVREMAQQS
jgi:hypothetical protein